MDLSGGMQLVMEYIFESTAPESNGIRLAFPRRTRVCTDGRYTNDTAGRSA